MNNLKKNFILESKTDNMNKKNINDVNRVIEKDIENSCNIPYWINLVSFSNYLNY